MNDQREENIENKKVPLTVKQAVLYVIFLITVMGSAFKAYYSNSIKMEAYEEFRKAQQAINKTNDDRNEANKARDEEMRQKIITLEAENKYRNR